MPLYSPPSAVSNINASQIANRTRTLWLPATQFILAVGTPTLTLVANSIPYWALDAASIEGVATIITMPADTVAGSVTSKIYWGPPDANAGNIVFGGEVALRVVGATLDVDTLANVTVASPAATTRIVASTLSTDTFVSATEAAGMMSQICIKRMGNNASDTYGSDIQFYGVLLEYTADS